MTRTWPGSPAVLLAAALSAGACGEATPSITDTTVLPPEPRVSLVKVDGDAQTDTVLATLPEPLRLLVLSENRPLAGATVRWYPGGGPGVISTTDAGGLASITWTLGPQAGEWSTAATVEGPDSVWVRFAATALPGQPVTLVKTSGDEQVGAVAQPLRTRYEVASEDAHGNLALLDADDVEWLVVSGGGSVESACPVTCQPQTSSVVHTLGPEEGRHEVRATLRELSVTFAATALTALVRLVPRGCRIGGCPPRFDPDSVEIDVGRTVGWTWSGTHQLMFDDGWAPPSGAHRTGRAAFPPQPTDGTYLRTFGEAGTYRFRCDLHSADFQEGEVGVVVVSP